MSDRGRRFIVTEDHLRLVARFNIGWGSDEFGAPCVDPKRPYGNSDVDRDICDILEWDYCPEDWEIPAGIKEDARKLHDEMQTVLQILCRNCGIKAGPYITTTSWRRDWEHLEPGDTE